MGIKLGFQDQANLRHDPTQAWIYVVGHINGDVELLKKTLVRIEFSQLLARNDKVVFLGNFLGEGGHNKEIIEILREYQNVRPGQVIILRGRAENRMIGCRLMWLKSLEGLKALESYKTKWVLPLVVESFKKMDASQFCIDRRWLINLPFFYKSEKYFFCHSGVDPEKPLGDQKMGALLYLDLDFYQSSRIYPKKIVHSCYESKLVVKSNRIAVGRPPDAVQCVVINDKKDAHGNFGKDLENMLFIQKYPDKPKEAVK